MKNKWHDMIRKRLKDNRKQCLACLSPDNDYSWGTNGENIGKTVALMNTLLKDIPAEAWPAYRRSNWSSNKIKSNNWTMKLFWDCKQRHADLKHVNDDHTAWVREYKKGVFGNYDIGGS